MNKYRNIQTTLHNITFASKKEARRYGELLVLLRAGEIRDLELQPRYDLVVNGAKIGFYKADFRYLDKNGITHIEDAKGVRTSVYALKKRIVKALYNIDVEEV